MSDDEVIWRNQSLGLALRVCTELTNDLDLTGQVDLQFRRMQWVKSDVAGYAMRPRD